MVPVMSSTCMEKNVVLVVLLVVVQRHGPLYRAYREYMFNRLAYSPLLSIAYPSVPVALSLESFEPLSPGAFTDATGERD
jgi:hypothetical protein